MGAAFWRSIGARVVKPDHIRRPLRIAHTGKKRRIGGQRHHIRVALHTGEESRLRQRAAKRVRVRAVHAVHWMRGVLARKDLDISRIRIVKIGVLVEPFRLDIIVLVHRVDKVLLLRRGFLVEVPCGLVALRGDIGAGGTDQAHLGIFCMDRLLKRLIAGEEIHLFRLPLLVADAHHRHAERSGVAHLRAHGAPFQRSPSSDSGFPACCPR